ncbi:MAG: family 78 glycoside hydrolase catalytic domain [Janthinobacterium lividum]
MTPFPILEARWIWTSYAKDTSWAVRRFRARFSLTEAQSIRLFVCADSRYALFCDGQRLGRGPARADVRHQMYDSYCIELEPGIHTLAAVVLAYGGESSPIAEMHDRGAFLCEVHGATGGVLAATGRADEWRVLTDTSVQPALLTQQEGYYGIGPSETVDGTCFPHGWEQPHFEDHDWASPVPVALAWPHEQRVDSADPGGRWRLLPRDIPFPRDLARRFSPEFAPVTVAAHSRYEGIVTPGEYVSGFPQLGVEGGLGSVVTLTYAEALTENGKKGIRDEGTDVSGFSDTYICGGGCETYTPLHWRAFRFVKITVVTGSTPLVVSALSYRQTGYPWQYKAAFLVENGPVELPAVLETDFRTLSCCTDETFMDCPYYEQLQYVGDTRLQALLSYVTTGDTRLGARAVRLFDWSRLPEGLTQSRYPSRMEQIIPPFSLLWILMAEDLARYAPHEAAAVQGCLPGCRAVLEWFARRVDTAQGVLPGALPWWNFVDWAPGFVDGAPPPFAAGRPCATLNLQYLAALQACARLHGETDGLPWQKQAEELSAAISRVFWDADRNLLREGGVAEGELWADTQHAQAWGILTGVVPPPAVQAVCDSLHTNLQLTPATYYHLFYVVEALAKAGRLESLWTHWLTPWQDALKMHLSTWPEQPEPTRSDCHAWSAWPTYALLTHVLGVQPAGTEEGSRYTVSPQRVTGWDRVKGLVPLPGGAVQVAVEWQPDGVPHISHALNG